MSDNIKFRTQQTQPLTHEELDKNFKYANFLEVGKNYLKNEKGLYIDNSGSPTVYIEYISLIEQEFNPSDLSDKSKWGKIGESTSFSLGIIGPAPDGHYGPDPGIGEPANSASPSGLDPTDTIPNALDKLDTTLARLLPPQPNGLDDITLNVSGLYTAKKANPITGDYTAGQTYSNVHDTQTGSVVLTTSDFFADGETGTLNIKVIENGSSTIDDENIVLSTSTTVGDSVSIGSGNLQIIDKTLLPVSQPFYPVIKSRVTKTLLITKEYEFILEHSNTGSTSRSISTDDPQGTGSLSVTQSSPLPSSLVTPTRYISGVPSLDNGDSIQFTYTVNNGVSEFYNSSRVGVLSGGIFNSVNSNPASVPSRGDSLTFNAVTTVKNGSFYDESPRYNLTGYDSKNQSASLNNRNPNLRIDTVSNENIRVTSGTGNFPSSGYGSSYNSSQSLSSNEELQLINGNFRWPSGNYSSLNFGGPDYSSLPSITRYATFNLGNITNASNFTFNITSVGGTWNVNPSKTISGLTLQLRVDGPTPTNGWLDANDTYSSGNPLNDGDASLVSGASTGIVSGNIKRQVTFGTAIKTGTVYIRIGYTNSSNKTFKNIVKV